MHGGLETIKAALTTYKWQCRSVDTGAALLHRLLYLGPMPGYVLQNQLQAARMRHGLELR